ncbi:hypothetical protein HanIR_Chr14g0675071 [Helianthus annuus]|nr:hypothetical protein HanIR_Chr14g0675071 [Helianthus annuus]
MELEPGSKPATRSKHQGGKLPFLNDWVKIVKVTKQTIGSKTEVNSFHKEKVSFLVFFFIKVKFTDGLCGLLNLWICP